MAPEKEAQSSGYLEVADFVKVVWYPKEVYPKGIKTYKVSSGDKEESDEGKD